MSFARFSGAAPTGFSRAANSTAASFGALASAKAARHALPSSSEARSAHSASSRALIAGSSNYVSPQATLDALVLGMNYFALWFVLGAAAIWFIGFETRGRTIEEIDSTLTAARTPRPQASAA